MLDGAGADHAGVCIPDVGQHGSSGGDPRGDEMTVRAGIFQQDYRPELFFYAVFLPKRGSLQQLKRCVL